MKKIKNSFLYFCVVFSWIHSNSIYSQKETDSLYHYYNFLKDAKKYSDLIKSYNFYNRHKEFSLKENDTIPAIESLRYMASIENKLDQIFESEATAVEALKLANSINNNEQKIGIYNHLGILAKKSNSYERAIEYYDKTLKILDTLSDINIVLNNKANVFRVQGKYKTALLEFEKVYFNSIKLKDTSQIARSLDHLGLVKSKLNHSDAIDDMLSALNFRLKLNVPFELYVSYIHLAEYYNDRNINDKVKYYASKAYSIASKLNNIEDKIKALSFLIGIKDDVKIKEYITLSDSLKLVRQLDENKYISTKYDYILERRKTSEAKIKLTESKLEQEKEKSKRITYQGIGLFILTTSALLFLFLRSKHKKDKLIQVYNTEARISKKVHDEVANDIYQIMTKIQNDNSQNETILDDLEDIYIKTRDISKENSNLNVNENFEGKLNDLLLSYKSETVNIITRNYSKIDWKSISEIKKITIYRVLQELMINMKKHSEASIVVLAFSQDKTLTINYSDNGKGCELIKNTGLQNVENRIKSIQGTVNFESEINNGFKSIITI